MNNLASFTGGGITLAMVGGVATGAATSAGVTGVILTLFGLLLELQSGA